MGGKVTDSLGCRMIRSRYQHADRDAVISVDSSRSRIEGTTYRRLAGKGRASQGLKIGYWVDWNDTRFTDRRRDEQSRRERPLAAESCAASIGRLPIGRRMPSCPTIEPRTWAALSGESRPGRLKSAPR